MFDGGGGCLTSRDSLWFERRLNSSYFSDLSEALLLTTSLDKNIRQKNKKTVTPPPPPKHSNNFGVLALFFKTSGTPRGGEKLENLKKRKTQINPVGCQHKGRYQ